MLTLALGGLRWLTDTELYAPSNAIVARVRRGRPRVRVAGGLLVLSAALVFCGAILADWVAKGGPGWLNFLVLLAVWDAFKFGLLAIAIGIRRVLSCLFRTRDARPSRFLAGEVPVPEAPGC